MYHGYRIECQPHAWGVFVVAVGERASDDVLNNGQVLDNFFFPLFPARVHRRRKQSPQKPLRDVLPLELPRSEEPPGWVISGPKVCAATLEERLAFFAGQTWVVRRLTSWKRDMLKNASTTARKKKGACLLKIVSSRQVNEYEESGL